MNALVQQIAAAFRGFDSNDGVPPVSKDSASQQFIRHVPFARPFSERKSSTTHSEQMVSPDIVSLGVCVSPPAISGGVIAVAVDSVETSTDRPWPHISVKSLKRLAPSRVNANTPATVLLEVGRIAVFAAIDHGAPRPVFARTRHAVGSKLRDGSLFDFLGGEATARFASAGSEVQLPNHSTGTAITHSVPISVSVLSVVGETNYQETTKPNSGKIFCALHSSNLCGEVGRVLAHTPCDYTMKEAA